MFVVHLLCFNTALSTSHVLIHLIIEKSLLIPFTAKDIEAQRY